jgi:hypothetical protein
MAATIWFYQKILDYKISGPDQDIVSEVLAANNLDDMRQCKEQLDAKLDYYRNFQNAFSSYIVLETFRADMDQHPEYLREIKGLDYSFEVIVKQTEVLASRLHTRIEAVWSSEIIKRQMLLAETQLEESRKAIEQAETVKRLTRLAFVFIPISTVCSAFGMNIREMSPNPSIHIFIITVASVTFLTFLAASSDVLRNFYEYLSAGDGLTLLDEVGLSMLSSAAGLTMFTIATVLRLILAPLKKMWRLGKEWDKKGHLLRKEKSQKAQETGDYGPQKEVLDVMDNPDLHVLPALLPNPGAVREVEQRLQYRWRTRIKKRL